MTWARWEGRYISDPYTYLIYAREMTSFYAAHRREPLFPFATKVSLWLLNDQDVAVSVTSAVFSLLAVWATFLVGRIAFSAPTGLLAALGMAVEMEVITWGVGGWRDDAFTCAVLLTLWALLRYGQRPNTSNGILLGLAGGAACLVRITAMSFFLPGLVALWWMLRQPVRARVLGLSRVALIATVVVAPFLVNCWRVYGDPLYAINVHADIYRATEGQTVQSSQTTREYLLSNMTSRPFEMIDTGVLGMTSYPFENKWTGFAPWGRWWLTVLPVMALAGLLLWLVTAQGRVMLIVLAGSLVPYAMTWRLIGDWRFTEHAYPFFLIAAAGLCVTVLERCRHLSLATLRAYSGPSTRQLVAVMSAAGIALSAYWIVARWLPVAVAREALARGEEVTFAAGGRDRSFFTLGWSASQAAGNVTSRTTTGRTGVVQLPLLRGSTYEATFRIDPFPRPPATAETTLPTVRLFVNGQPAGRIALTWDPDRVGLYTIALPAILSSTTTIELVPEEADGRPGSPKILLWYVRVHPLLLS